MNAKINMISKHFALAIIGCAFLSVIIGCDLSIQSIEDSALILPPNSTPPKLTKPTTNAGPLADMPASTSSLSLPERKLELLKCTAVAETASRYKLTVNYQFLAGPPNPDFQYLISVTFPGCKFGEMKVVEGRSLSSSGTIEWTYNLPADIDSSEPEASTVRFVISEQYELFGNQRSFQQIGSAAITMLDKSALGL